MLVVVSILLYLVAAGLLVSTRFRVSTVVPRLSRGFAMVVASLAVTAQGLGIARIMSTPRPINLDFGNALDLTGAAVALVVIVGSFFEPVSLIGILVFPLAGLTALAPLINEQPFIVHTGHVLLDVHIVLAVLAYAILALAAAEALVLWGQEAQLKRMHEERGMVGLPPLLLTERMLFQLILTGFILLTFVLLSGLVYLHELLALHLLSKAIISFVAWCLFGGLLLGRHRYGWRGRVAAGWTLGAFTLLALSYLGTKLLWELAAVGHLRPLIG